MDETRKQIKEIALSDDTYKKIGDIGNKYDLMLDLQDELAAETQDIIMGFKDGKTFVKDIQERLEIDSDLAFKIAEDVNNLVIKPIKDKFKTEPTPDSIIFNESEISPLPDKQPATPSYSIPTKKPNPVVTSIPTYTHPPEITKDIPNIEKVGNFKIEESTPSTIENKSQEIDKDKVLQGIEEPEKLEQVSMIDHLLTTPVSNKEKVIDKKVEVKEYKTDPYRETI